MLLVFLRFRAQRTQEVRLAILVIIFHRIHSCTQEEKQFLFINSCVWVNQIVLDFVCWIKILSFECLSTNSARYSWEISLILLLTIFLNFSFFIFSISSFVSSILHFRRSSCTWSTQSFFTGNFVWVLNTFLTNSFSVLCKNIHKYINSYP